MSKTSGLTQGRQTDLEHDLEQSSHSEEPFPHRGALLVAFTFFHYLFKSSNTVFSTISSEGQPRVLLGFVVDVVGPPGTLHSPLSLIPLRSASSATITEHYSTLGVSKQQKQLVSPALKVVKFRIKKGVSPGGGLLVGSSGDRQTGKHGRGQPG